MIYIGIYNDNKFGIYSWNDNDPKLLFTSIPNEKYIEVLEYYSKHLRFFPLGSYYDRFYGETFYDNFYNDLYRYYHKIPEYNIEIEKVLKEYIQLGNGFLDLCLSLLLFVWLLLSLLDFK